jgi:steroid delta-isomerase-like uncharacterized protein
MKRIMAVTVMCVAMMLMGAPVRAQAPQSRCAQIGQKWVDFWNSPNVQTAADMFSDVFTEDVEYNDIPTDPTKPVAKGRDELLVFASRFFEAFPKSNFELRQSACQGRQGFFETFWIAEDGRVDVPGSGFCGTGKPFTVRGVTAIEIQGNRISRNSDFWDLATVLRQLLPEGQECVARLVGLGEQCVGRSLPVGPAGEPLRRDREGA